MRTASPHHEAASRCAILAGRIDIPAKTTRYIYVIELKLQKNGGKEAGIQQIITHQYLEPFKTDKRQTIGLAIELEDIGKGLLDWKECSVDDDGTNRSSGKNK